jgi:hypothetical protein
MRLRVAAPPRSEGYAVPMGGAVHREANVRVDPLEGQPLSTVIAKIGQPMGERSIAGKRVYYWGTPTPLSSKSDRGPQCQIQATMNGDVVERLAYEGDEALCLKYAARFRS